MIDRRMIPQLGCEISRLGYGGMRFPKNGDEVDVEEAVKLLRKAYDMGVNYFDTAVVYHKGESEKIFGKAFEIYDRSSYYLADKMSIWVCKDEQEMKDLFERQLKTLKTDYIDFYLVHSLNRNHYQKVKEFHCVEFLQEMKRQGKIKHLGFSFHDTYPVFTQILNDYDWDFVQIQLNYLDWQNQGAEQLYRELEKRNLPCTGCRYCMDCPMGVDIPEIFAIYSRLKIFGKDKSFVEDYKEVMENGNGAEHCIGCQQCMNHCPQSIEIPDKLAMIHRLYLDKKAELEL